MNKLPYEGSAAGQRAITEQNAGSAEMIHTEKQVKGSGEIPA